MKKYQPSQGQEFCEFGGVEKSGEHLLDIAGLSEESNCSTIIVQQSKGGAIMEEKIKQAEGEEELLREALHNLLDSMTEKQAEDLIPYLAWISKIPYSS